MLEEFKYISIMLILFIIFYMTFNSTTTTTTSMNITREYVSNAIFESAESLNESIMDLPICKTMESEHVFGEWIRTNFSKDESWPCCGWDANLYLQYPKECGGKMKRQAHSSFAGNKKFFAHSGGGGCGGFCDPKNHSFISATWKPKNCILSSFDSRKFCQDILRDRNILLVGDSTMGQTASILMNAVHFDCPQQIRWVPSDTLIHKQLGVLNRGIHWTKAVAAFDSDIIILNAGEHIRQQKDFLNMIEDVYNEYDRTYAKKKKMMIWKTVSPGGIHQMGFLKEMQNLSDPQIMERMKSFGYESEWAWDKQQIFDGLAKAYFRDKNIPILDVEPLYYRMDNHDGTNLHHCAHGDGALRIIPRILQHLLQEIDQRH